MNKLIILSITLLSLSFSYADNAALGYWIAAADSQGIPEKWDADDLQAILHQGDELSQEQNRWLDSCAFTIKEILRSSQRENCQFVPKASYEDGFNTLLPHLARMLPLNKILVLHARRLGIRKQYEKATQAYIASLRFANHVAKDPIVISSLVSYAMLRDTLSGIESLAFQQDFPTNLRSQLHKTIVDTTPKVRKAIHKAYLSEKLLFDPIIKEIKNKKYEKLLGVISTHTDEGLREKLADYPNPTEENLSQQQRKKVAEILSVPESVLKTKDSFLQYLVDGVYEFQQQTESTAKIFALDYQKGSREYKKINSYVANGHFLVRQFAAVAVYKRYVEMMISLNRMQVALALCIERKKTGGFPNNLDEIVADSFLHLDNFQYQQTKDGGISITIYDALSMKNFICKVRKTEEANAWKWIFTEKKL